MEQHLSGEPHEDPAVGGGGGYGVLSSFAEAGHHHAPHGAAVAFSAPSAYTAYMHPPTAYSHIPEAVNYGAAQNVYAYAAPHHHQQQQQYEPQAPPQEEQRLLSKPPPKKRTPRAKSRSRSPPSRVADSGGRRSGRARKPVVRPGAANDEEIAAATGERTDPYYVAPPEAGERDEQDGY